MKKQKIVSFTKKEESALEKNANIAARRLRMEETIDIILVTMWFSNFLFVSNSVSKKTPDVIANV